MNDEEEANILRKAILAFQDNFILYVEEMNPELHRRAMDYAKTFIDDNNDIIEDEGE